MIGTTYRPGEAWRDLYLQYGKGAITDRQGGSLTGRIELDLKRVDVKKVKGFQRFAFIQPDFFPDDLPGIYSGNRYLVCWGGGLAPTPS